ncbi:MAG: arylsulfatase [Pseudomonadota bacterium]
MKTLAIAVVAFCLTSCGQTQAPIERPLNFLIIMADDMAYTDMGAFGGEIKTPNLDQLAYEGVRLTHFHTAPSCAPTRAMLLTGTDNHLVGLGSQGGLVTPAQAKLPGYGNALLPEYPTIAEMLKAAGYQTFASAKWHVGSKPEALPKARGFDRSFVLLEGGAGHLDDTPMFSHYNASWLEDDQPVALPEHFYSTDEMTNRLISYLEGKDQDAPFFAYLAFTAPHWPLQALPEDIDKYAQIYGEGWHQLHRTRLTGAKESGVIASDVQGVPWEPGVPDWTSLSAQEQQLQTKTMQVYAAMIDRLDQNVGKLIQFLKAQGEYEDTVIVFLSDNGAEAHMMEIPANRQGWVDENFDNTLENLGTARSYITLGPGWARATAAPFRDSKSKISEGGIRVPAFVNLPAHRLDQIRGRVDHSYHRVMDLAPTLLDAASADVSIPNYPDAFKTGRSQWHRWTGGPPAYADDDIVAAELYGRRMARQGRWKVLLQEAPYGTGQWQLYDLGTDPGEQVDLSDEFPEVKRRLVEAWQNYAVEVGVLLPEEAPWY